jgi:hypothetical protein
VFIEFELTPGYSPQLDFIKNAISIWAEQQQIKYTQKTVKHTHRLAFDNDKHYNVFVLTWDSEFEYQLIDKKW